MSDENGLPRVEAVSHPSGAVREVEPWSAGRPREAGALSGEGQGKPEENEALRRELVHLRTRAGSDLGLTTASTPSDIAAMVWSMKGRKGALQVAELIVRRAHPGKTLKQAAFDG